MIAMVCTSSSNIVAHYQTRHKQEASAMLKAASLTEKKAMIDCAVFHVHSTQSLMTKFETPIKKLRGPFRSK